jgi:hypothetical protein
MDCTGVVAELLHFLIRRLDEAFESGAPPDALPLLLRLDGADVACATDGVDLHIKSFEGHPAQFLAGFTAPPEWFGVGVVTGGWAYEPGQEQARVRVTSFVCRDGTELTAIRRTGGKLEVLEGRGEGEVLDTLRRVVGLPTGPGSCSSTRR